MEIGGARARVRGRFIPLLSHLEVKIAFIIAHKEIM